MLKQNIETYGGPYMGLAPAQNSLLEKQVVISIVANNSPAAKAGLKKGDRIFEFNGKDVTSWKTVIAELDHLKVGDTVTLKVKRANPHLKLNGQTIKNDQDLKNLFKFLKDGQSLNGQFKENDILEFKMVLGERR